ncbi:MAG: hypothetical protein HYY86_02620 [Candidatus Harrisonbacteria bacterium]|nr:hypothetical protein [Candidatus Harrisonbacteria bacterium]
MEPEMNPHKEIEEIIRQTQKERLRKERLMAEQKILAREKAIRETEEGIKQAGVTAEDIEQLEKAVRIQRLKKPDSQI